MYRNLLAESLAARGLYRRAATLYRRDALNDWFSHDEQEMAQLAAERCERKAQNMSHSRALKMGMRPPKEPDRSGFNGRVCGYIVAGDGSPRGRDY